MSTTSTEGRIDITEEVLAKNMAHPRDPGAFFYEPWPEAYESDLIKELQESNPAIEKISMDTETEPKLASNFLRVKTREVVITSAESGLPAGRSCSERMECGWLRRRAL